MNFSLNNALAKLSKFFAPLFYLTAMLLVVFFAWGQQRMVRQGGNSPLYQNLMDNQAYVRRGFDLADIYPADILKITEGSGIWFRHENALLRVVSSSLPDLPKRSFFSPWGMEAEEFTIVIPIEMDSRAISFLDANPNVFPGVYFAGIGENWEIYFNGTKILSEIHQDENGKIQGNRTWRNVSFPLANTLIVPGANILALRIIGDPSYNATGLSFRSPHYMDDYRIIEGRKSDYYLVILCFIAAYIGMNYLILFLSIKNRREIFNLYFSFFSILLCIHIFTRHILVYSLIPDSDISIRLEYGSLMLLVPMFGFFLETLGREKTTYVSKIYLAFSLLLVIAQVFFSAQFGEDATFVWNIVTIAYCTYLVLYS